MSGEADYLITYDERRYPLHSMSRRGLLNLSGLFNIPVNYQTTRGYQQDGVTVLDHHLTSRTLSLLVKDTGHCRDDYWLTRRYKLLEALRMNRGGPLSYLKVLPDGQQRQIDCWLQSGPTQANDQGSPDAMTMQASFTLMCPDPAFYNPLETVYLVPVATDLELEFPITFPIVFGAGAAFAGAITYTGTWRSYPSIQLTGPYNYITVTNTTASGEASVTLSVPLTTGTVITLYLTPGAQRIENAAGNVLPEVPASGSLLDWALLPDPLATDGANAIAVSGSGFGATTAVQIQYNTRYAAL